MQQSLQMKEREVAVDEPMSPARVVQLMSAAAGDARVVSAGAGALRGIAFTAEARGACVASGAIPALVGALTRHAGEAGVCDNASAALANIMTSSDAHRVACATAGAIPALVGALTRHVGEAGVCTNASTSLRNITATSNAHRDVCATAGAIPALVGALTRHAGEAGVCANASGALRNIAWTNPAHRAAAVAVGAVPRLAAAWAAHPSAKVSTHSALEKLGYADNGQLL
jgi:hypothetical protein